MIIGFGADHRGFKLKEELKEELKKAGYTIRDFGTSSLLPVDYPDIAFSVTEALQKREIDRAVLICGSGLGMSIAANKMKGIRATLCLNKEMAKMARNHNDSNVLVLAANFTEDKVAKEILKVWLEEQFEGGRHQQRLDKITELENLTQKNH